MNVKELRKRAGELNIPGRSTMDRAALEAAITAAEIELEGAVGTIERTDFIKVYGGEIDLSKPVEFPSVESAHRMVDAFGEAYPALKAHAKRHANKLNERRVIRMVRASQSRRYGQNGRGMGAVHFPGMYGRPGQPNQVTHDDALRMLSYGDRARHYAKQTGQPTASCDGVPGPVLTHRQWRRLNKKDNRNRFLHRPTKEARYA